MEFSRRKKGRNIGAWSVSQTNAFIPSFFIVSLFEYPDKEQLKREMDLFCIIVSKWKQSIKIEEVHEVSPLHFIRIEKEEKRRAEEQTREDTRREDREKGGAEGNIGQDIERGRKRQKTKEDKGSEKQRQAGRDREQTMKSQLHIKACPQRFTSFSKTPPS